LNLAEQDKNALIFSIIIAANSVFNNTADQKSSFKQWLPKCLKDVIFELPALISGPLGMQTVDDIMKLKPQRYDFVYLDPPYSNSVLYSACYHINDSIAIWDKPKLNGNYALPRPPRADFSIQDKGKSFYSSKTIKDDFDKLISTFSNSKRIVISYSDAPKNLISIEDIITIGKKYGTVKVENTEHKICTQIKSQNKQIDSLREYFIIIDI
jgi:adenine-specific DNA methylase